MRVLPSQQSYRLHEEEMLRRIERARQVREALGPPRLRHRRVLTLLAIGATSLVAVAVGIGL